MSYDSIQLSTEMDTVLLEVGKLDTPFLSPPNCHCDVLLDRKGDNSTVSTQQVLISAIEDITQPTSSAVETLECYHF